MYSGSLVEPPFIASFIADRALFRLASSLSNFVYSLGGIAFSTGRAVLFIGGDSEMFSEESQPSSIVKFCKYIH